MSERSKARTALLIVDVQKDFCPGGALAVPNGDRVTPILNRMIERVAARGGAVYASRDWHPRKTTHFSEFGGPWPVHCVAGTPGAEIHPDLLLPSDAVIISKGQRGDDDGYSAFEGSTEEGRQLTTDLRQLGVSHLFVGGLATDFCVRATVLDALSEGFQVTVLTDAVAGVDSENSKRALQQMRQAGASLIDSSEAREIQTPTG